MMDKETDADSNLNLQVLQEIIIIISSNLPRRQNRVTFLVEVSGGRGPGVYKNFRAAAPPAQAPAPSASTAVYTAHSNLVSPRGLTPLV